MFKFVSLVFGILALLSGCQNLTSNSAIYAAHTKPLTSGSYEVSVEARLEQEAINETTMLANTTCHDKHKKRGIVASQKSEHVNSAQSKHATGYYRVTSLIKCK